MDRWVAAEENPGTEPGPLEKAGTNQPGRVRSTARPFPGSTAGAPLKQSRGGALETRKDGFPCLTVEREHGLPGDRHGVGAEALLCHVVSVRRAGGGF